VIDAEFEKDLLKSIYRDSYYEFYVAAFKILHPGEDYSDNWHAKYICDQLQVEAERISRKEKRDKDIIINIPFRSSKSMICTVIFPVWAWTFHPEMKFISVSYSASLALEHATRSRDLILSNWFQELYLGDFELKSDANSKSDYRNNKGGMRKAVGNNGQITGSGADVIIVDDPISPKLASSAVERKNALDFYSHTLFSRLNNPDVGIRIIVMQRLHQEDLSGYLMDTRPERHKHICIPAEIGPQLSPKELEVNYIDGLFWSDRFNRGALQDYKVSLGSNQYAGQLQQIPSPEEGGIIKRDWFDIVEANTLTRNPLTEPIEFFVDGAYTAKTENDPSGLMACFVKNNFIYILNVTEVWLEFPQLCEFIGKYAHGNAYTNNSRIKVEPKATGISVVQSLRAASKLNIIETAPPTDDKTTRLNAVSPIIEGRRVKLVKGAWNKAYLDQVTTFPNAKHDEFVDLTVMAINELLVNNGFSWSFI